MSNLGDISSAIISRACGPIMTLSINRPEKRNSLTKAMWLELAEMMERLGAEKAIRGIILTGEEGCFSAGADISEFESARSGAMAAQAYDDAVDACCRAIERCAKATIAVVDGACIGGGVALAMACDFRIVTPRAVFGVPAARLSIVYSEYNTRKLVALCGISEAKKILFTGDRMKAEEALEIGLADRVSPAAMDDALAMAGAISKNAPLSIAAAKLILARLVGAQSEIARDAIFSAIRLASNSQDAKEARQAFKDKREPQFVAA